MVERHANCRHCGEALEPGVEVVARCRGCGRLTAVEAARHARALDALRATLEDLGDLRPEARADFLRCLHRHAAVAGAEADAAEAAATRRCTPPPPPPRDAAPAPAAAGRAPRARAEPPAQPAPPAPVSPPPRPRREGPSLWARLGPLFAENLLFALAAFLLVAGAVYFATTAWTTMTGTQRLLVVFGGVHALAGLLLVAARLAHRRSGGTLPELVRAATWIAAFLGPVGAALAGRLLHADALLGALASAIALAAGVATARAAAALAPRPAGEHLVAGTALLLGAAVAAPWWAPALEIGGVALAAGVAWAASAGGTGRRGRAATGLTLLAFAATVAFAGAALAPAAAAGGRGGAQLWAPFGALLAAVGVVVARGLGAAPRPAARAAALALAITGAGVAWATPACALPATAAGTWIAGRAAFALRHARWLWPALALSAVTYLLLPAPVRELAQSLRDRAGGALGYAPGRLPLSFYGLSFVPYVGAVAGWVVWLLRRRWPRHARVAQRWVLALATGLVTLSIVAGSDLRAPTAVLGAQGVLLLAAGIAGRRVRFVQAGVVLLFGCLGAALLWWAPARAWTAGVPAVAGLLALGLGDHLARRARSALARHGAATLVRTGALAALVTTAAAGWRLLHAGADPRTALWAASALPGDAVGYGLLALWLARLGRSHAQPWLRVLACGVLGRAALGAAALLGVGDPASPWTPLVLAAAGAGLAARAARDPRVPSGLLVLGSFLVAPAAAAWATPATAQLAALAAPAGLLAYLAVLLRSAALHGAVHGTVVATLGLAAPGVLLARWLLGPGDPAVDAAGLALTAALATALARAHRAGPCRVAARQVGQLQAGLALLGLALLRATAGWPGDAPWLAAGGAALVVAAGVFGTERRAPAALLLGGVGALAAGLLGLAVLDGLRLPVEVAGVGLGLAALLLAAGLAPRLGLAPRHAQHHEALLLGAGLLGTALTGALVAEPWYGALALSAALLALASHVALPAAAEVCRTLLVGLALLGAGWYGLGRAALGLDARWLLPWLPLGTSALLLATRAPRLGLTARGMAWLSVPVAASYGVWLLLQLGRCVALQLPPPFEAVGAWSYGLTLLGFWLLCVLRALASRAPLDLGLAAAASLLVVAVLAPLNHLLPQVAGRWPRPDLELALAGLAAAALPRRAAAALGASAAGAAALLLTAAEVAHVSTPLTVTVATLAVPLAHRRRSASATAATLAWLGLLATALAWVTFAHAPRPAPAHAAPWWAAVAALVAAAQHRGARRAALPVAVSTLTTWLAAALWVVAAAARPAPAGATAAVVGGLLLVALVTARRAPARAAFAHAAVASAALAYGALALHSDALAPLEGLHGHVLASAGIAVLVLAHRRRGALRRALVVDGLLLLLPAAALGAALSSLRAAGGLLLAAVGTFLAGRLLRDHLLLRRVLHSTAAALLNLALFAVWRHHGVVDPAFYCVPAGLTLLLAAELERGRWSAAWQRLCWWSGAALAFGSLALQVLRVEQPMHAAALLGAGLLAVAGGVLRRRADLLLAGTAAVVGGVLAYLLRHGLERDFVAATMLLAAGGVVLVSATTLAQLRKRGAVPPPPDPDIG